MVRVSSWTPESSEGVTGNVRHLAKQVGAADLLIFRRICPGRYAHIGGIGRGEGWAGIVEVEAADDPLLAEALTGRRPVRTDSPVAVRVAGPYFARAAAAGAARWPGSPPRRCPARSPWPSRPATLPS